jgi:hypothetical protein
MKTMRTIILLLFLLSLAVLPSAARAAEPQVGSFSGQPDQFIFGDNYILDTGETLSGSLWVFGGNADLRSGSRVSGDIHIFGGKLTVDGLVEGDIQAAGGNVQLRDNADVRGDITIAGGSLSRSNGAQVQGDIVDQRSGPFTFPRPGIVPVTPPNMNFANPFLELVSFLFQSLLTAALAVLVALFIPVQTERVARTVVTQPLISGGLGLVTVVILPIVMIVLLVTIILIPVSLLLGLALGLAMLFGWIAIGLELGKRMARLFKSEWTLPLAAGVGTLTLSLVIGGAGKYVMCIGWLLPTLTALVGLGAVLLTRFGTQSYPPFSPPYGTPPAPVPAPYSAPVQPYNPYDAAPPQAGDPGSAWESGLPEGPGSTTSGGADVYPLDDDAPPTR